MQDIETMIVERWHSLPTSSRSVRAVLAALLADGINVGRTTVHKTITAHKRGVAREIVADEAKKMGEVLGRAAVTAITPEAAQVVMESTGSAMERMEALAAALSDAAIYSLRGDQGKPASVGEIATLTSALTGLGDMLTRAHIARNGMQRLADVTERVSSEGPKDVTPAPPPPTRLASALTMIHGAEGE